MTAGALTTLCGQVESRKKLGCLFFHASCEIGSITSAPRNKLIGAWHSFSKCENTTARPVVDGPGVSLREMSQKAESAHLVSRCLTHAETRTQAGDDVAGTVGRSDQADPSSPSGSPPASHAVYNCWFLLPSAGIINAPDNLAVIGGFTQQPGCAKPGSLAKTKNQHTR